MVEVFERPRGSCQSNARPPAAKSVRVRSGSRRLSNTAYAWQVENQEGSRSPRLRPRRARISLFVKNEVILGVTEGPDRRTRHQAAPDRINRAAPRRELRMATFRPSYPFGEDLKAVVSALKWAFCDLDTESASCRCNRPTDVTYSRYAKEFSAPASGV
jgi:hypothetical protein